MCMMHMKIIGTPLYQWEVGRQLQITPIRNIPVDFVHFANPGDPEALVVVPKEENGQLIVDIPNVLLQNGNNIVAYSVSVSSGKIEIIRECVFSVCYRPKPSDYVYTETEILHYRVLEDRMKNLEDDLDKQVASSIDDYLRNNPPQDGLTKESKTLLVTILQSALFGTDQSGNILRLAKLLGVNVNDEPDVPDIPDIPVIPDEPDEPEIPDQPVMVSTAALGIARLGYIKLSGARRKTDSFTAALGEAKLGYARLGNQNEL